MVIGASGTGKSTVINAILQGSQNMSLDGDSNIVASKELKYNKKPVFVFYEKHDIYVVDCPDLQDQDKMREYPN